MVWLLSQLCAAKEMHHENLVRQKGWLLSEMSVMTWAGLQSVVQRC